jgi:glutamine synthetase
MDRLDDLDLLRFLWVDNANLIRAKAVSLLSEPRPNLERTVRISQAMMAMPAFADTVIEQTGLLPTHDVTLVPDWTTLRRVGHRQAVVSCDIFDGEAPWAHCPRSFLRRMNDRARAAGMSIRAGTELEFSLLRDGAPIERSSFAQDWAFDAMAPLVHDLLTGLRAQAVDVAQIHPESGDGQWEISLRPLPIVQAADTIVASRQIIRAVAADHGMTVNFLPMTDAEAVGAGMHVHMSFTGDDSDGFGPFGDPFIAGVVEHLLPLVAATAPSPLSTARFRPRYWAGAFVGWGDDNKEAPLRVIRTDEGEPRDVEFKASDASANPYILLGCLLAVGLDGIARQVQLPAPLVGDPGLLTEAERHSQGIVAMPTDPFMALAEFQASGLFREAMGALHHSYCAVRRAELDHLRDLDIEDVIAVLVDKI